MEISQPSGTGPGARTRDGCSVEFYRRVPYRGELQALEGELAGGTVLELGCGAGRLTRRLLRIGARVCAVDNSREMLDCLPEGAEQRCADIASLGLSRTFDCVLLASYIYNTPIKASRLQLARVSRAHLNEGGAFFLQVHDQKLLDITNGQSNESDGVVTTIEHVDISGTLVEMQIRYAIDGASWTHEFQTEVLEFDDIERELHDAGFRSLAWIDREKGWLRATA